jgi:AcrR family transcriptional regulator
MTAKQDRRSLRTRHLLSDALVALIREKGYDSITVSDIIACADIGRSTFYTHYQDKDDLFVSELDRVIEVLGQHDSPEPEMPFFPSLGLFRHVGEEYELYKSLVWSSGIDLLVKHMQKSLSARIEQGLEKSGQEFEVPLPILASFIAGSFLTVLRWWLENKRLYTPEQMDEIFKKLVGFGIQPQENTN